VPELRAAGISLGGLLPCGLARQAQVSPISEPGEDR
jgi:hypothetical protein